LQPNLVPPNGAKRQKSLDFSLLLLWWLFLYLFFVIPWQYVTPDEARYGSNYNFLSLLMDVVLRALYEAKAGGKNRAVGVSPGADGKSFPGAKGSDAVSVCSVQTICPSKLSPDSVRKTSENRQVQLSPFAATATRVVPSNVRST
jgi:hypothetical protein